MKVTYLDSVIKPPHSRVRDLSDYARPQKTTQGTKLKGRWDSRATPVRVRYVTPTPPENRITPRVVDTLARYNESHRLYA